MNARQAGITFLVAGSLAISVLLILAWAALTTLVLLER